MNKTAVLEAETGINSITVSQAELDNVEAILSRKKRTLLVKRIYDVVFSSLGLLVLSPLLIVVAILIKLDSPGPVFYRQTRIGKNQQEFEIL